MKLLDWNERKNTLLKQSRGVGFEDVVSAIAGRYMLGVIKYANSEKYPPQRLYVVAINDYAYTVPFVEATEVCFLKTIFPSRKYTKQYLRKKD